MIFESFEFTEQSDFDRAYKNVRDKVKNEFNLEHFRLNSDYIVLFGLTDEKNWIRISDSSIYEKKQSAKCFTIFKKYKLVTLDLKIKRRKQSA